MNMIRTYRIVIFLLLWGVAFSPENTFGQGVTKITRYFLAQTITQQPATVKPYTIKQEEGFYPDTLFQVLSKDGYPLAYYRNITQEVCFDEKCRLMRLNLYWNITGRYLGIELPVGEFLSKAEHTPFSEKEYQLLNSLLADSLSALVNFSYSELVPKADVSYKDVDGVTSATSRDVLSYVVPGAVYTTYTLWHLIYGKTRQEVIRLTGKSMTADLAVHILNSPDRSDRFWMLDRIGKLSLAGELQHKVLAFIDDDSYNLAEKTLNSIRPGQLAVDSLQYELLQRFDEVGYSIRALILNKLLESDKLLAGTNFHLATRLPSLRGELLLTVFRIFRKQRVSDPKILHMIAALLDHDNRFIGRQAFEYLKFIRPDNPDIRKKMERYASG